MFVKLEYKYDIICYKMQLPSNKISTLFIVVVLVVVLSISGDVIFKKIKKLDIPELIDADLILQRQTTDQTSIDRDSDGLLDWQESLYGSDSLNSDTDGDGTNDGDEIKDGRDPRISGPNDSLVRMSDLINTEFDVEDYTPGSLTDNLSVNFFGNYLKLKGENNLTQETGQQLIDQTINQVTTNTSLQNKYQISNLKSVTSDKETLTKYGNDFALIYLNYVNQLKIINSTDDNQYLELVANKYQEFAKDLASMNVPSVALNVHVQIINKINNVGVLTSELKRYGEDPVKGLFAMKNLKENSNGETQLYSVLANYFKDNDIIFNNNDVARFWNLYE